MGSPGPLARVSAGLPDFPWDLLQPAKTRAATHPDGLVDLSIGTPVDHVPASVQRALAVAADAPGYPATAGTAELRRALVDYLSRHCDAALGEESVLPTIGSKELVAALPSQLGLRSGDRVVIPSVCYPTYEVGARLAGASVVRADHPSELSVEARLVWVNSPANPHGRVLSAAELRDWVAWARAHGAVLASDECYLELGFETSPVSALAPAVTQGVLTGVLAVHSLSKRSNLAGYRAGFVAGDPALVGELLAVRKQAGLMVPAPVQAAMVAALGDAEHAVAQRAIYAARRSLLRPALEAAGLRIDDSQAGLYLWATRGEACWSTVDWFAARGILVAPGDFYGPTGASHVRLALTATDERIAAAAARLR
ncbi:MAG TPA: succinyldiaminopimelate transaminase [Micromonosporaceae bacterium]